MSFDSEEKPVMLISQSVSGEPCVFVWAKSNLPSLAQQNIMMMMLVKKLLMLLMRLLIHLNGAPFV